MRIQATISVLYLIAISLTGGGEGGGVSFFLTGMKHPNCSLVPLSNLPRPVDALWHFGEYKHFVRMFRPKNVNTNVIRHLL